MISCIAVWDFLDGHKDILCQSHLGVNMLDGKWNFYLGNEANEFVTVSEMNYHYWKVANNLTLQYQEGDIPKDKKSSFFSSKGDHFTTCEFAMPTPEQLSVYLILGLSNGYAMVSDSRCNQFKYTVKILDGAIRSIFCSKSKILVEGSQDQ